MLFKLSCLLLPVHAIALTQNPLESWIKTESVIAEARMFANISPGNVAPGVILASPSRANPNYFYYWVRDGAMVARTVTHLLDSANSTKRAQYLSMLDTYARFTRDNQARTVMNLGEPRFNVDGSLNTEPWGRPQNDGPALRALALTRYANILLSQGERQKVENLLYSARLPADTAIKADLEFVAHHWPDPCVDLWEEVWGKHFFTRAVQLAALREGARLAGTMNDPQAATFYVAQADLIETELANHWSDQRGHYLATLEFSGSSDHQKPTQLDTSVILGALVANQGAGPLALTDDRMLATVAESERTFAAQYTINRGSGAAPAIGRYPEDYYYGGNPWVLTTAAFAEYYYRLVAIIDQSRPFIVTAGQAQFFMRLISDTVTPGTDLASTPHLKAKIVDALFMRGDAFMTRLWLHANPDGSYAEQIHRDTGFMLSAYDLSWSYSGFLEAARVRGL